MSSKFPKMHPEDPKYITVRVSRSPENPTKKCLVLSKLFHQML
jgi:hypothetical protein